MFHNTKFDAFEDLLTWIAVFIVVGSVFLAAGKQKVQWLLLIIPGLIFFVFALASAGSHYDTVKAHGDLKAQGFTVHSVSVYDQWADVSAGQCRIHMVMSELDGRYEVGFRFDPKHGPWEITTYTSKRVSHLCDTSS